MQTRPSFTADEKEMPTSTTSSAALTPSSLRPQKAQQAVSPLLPRTPPSALYSHVALATSQLIFAISVTVVRAAFKDSADVSPIVIILFRLLLSLGVFAVVHWVRMFRRRKARSTTGGPGNHDGSDHHHHHDTENSSTIHHVGEHDNGSTTSEQDDHPTAESNNLSADEFSDLTLPMKLRCVALGIAGCTVNMLCASTGVKYADAVTSGAFQCAIPPLTCFIAFLCCNESLTLPKMLSLGMAVVGNLIMVHVWCVFSTDMCNDDESSSSNASSASSYYLGCLFLLANVVAYSGYLVFQRPVVRLLPKSEFLFRTYLYGFIGVAVVALCRVDLVWEQLTTPGIITGPVCVAIAFSGLVNSTFAYYLVSVGIAGVSPAAAAIYFSLQPLFVGALSTIFLGEGVTLVQAGGGVLIIAGLLMSAAPINLRAVPTAASLKGQSADHIEKTGVSSGDEKRHCGWVTEANNSKATADTTIGATVSGAADTTMNATVGGAAVTIDAESPRNLDENAELSNESNITSIVQGITT